MDTKLHTLRIKTFFILCFICLSAHIHALTWMVGSYVGDGGSNHQISGLTFKPDFVIIKADAAQAAFVKTNTMTGTQSRQYTSVTATVTDAITSFYTNGFYVGTNAAVNNPGTTYYFYAFQKGASMVTGSYTGTGGSKSYNAGAKTEWVLVFPEDDYGSSCLFTTGSGGGYAYDSRWKSGVSVNVGSGGSYSSFSSTGFPINSAAPFTNVSGTKYHYVGFVEKAAECVISSFAGNGADNRNIAITGFKPNFVMTTNTNGGEVVFKGGNITVDKSQYTNNIVNATNLIQSVYSSGSNGGFQVGSDDNVNPSGNTQFYLAFGGAAGGVLPVELLHFDAQRTTGKNVLINWSTASEENNNYFVVERSEDGISFEPVGQVEGANNSSHRLNYQFLDENAPLDVTVYYRLRQIDNDGVSKVFNTVAVPVGETSSLFDVSILQNPVTNEQLQYELILPEDVTMNVQIFDNLGNSLSSMNYYYSHGTNRYALDIGTLKAGVYILNVTDLNGGSKKAVRFVVNK